MAFTFVQGDTLSVLKGTIKDQGGNAIDLSAYTFVGFRWSVRARQGKTSKPATISTATAVDLANGVIQYQWQANELEAGTLEVEFRGLDASSRVIHSNHTVEFDVKPLVGQFVP